MQTEWTSLYSTSYRSTTSTSHADDRANLIYVQQNFLFSKFDVCWWESRFSKLVEVLQLHRCTCAATHCNTLQHTATHFNTLQHTAPKCSRENACAQNERTNLYFNPQTILISRADKRANLLFVWYACMCADEREKERMRERESCICLYTYICIYMYIYIYICAYVYIYIQRFIYIYVCVRVCRWELRFSKLVQITKKKNQPSTTFESWTKTK